MDVKDLFEQKTGKDRGKMTVVTVQLNASQVTLLDDTWKRTTCKSRAEFVKACLLKLIPEVNALADKFAVEEKTVEEKTIEEKTGGKKKKN
jgi:metal-responsive CopG/Arc/MetJ family transcriptional regulator